MLVKIKRKIIFLSSKLLNKSSGDRNQNNIAEIFNISAKKKKSVYFLLNLNSINSTPILFTFLEYIICAKMSNKILLYNK